MSLPSEPRGLDVRPEPGWQRLAANTGDGGRAVNLPYSALREKVTSYSMAIPILVAQLRKTGPFLARKSTA
jgi:hypothetical protein